MSAAVSAAGSVGAAPSVAMRTLDERAWSVVPSDETAAASVLPRQRSGRESAEPGVEQGC